MIAASRLHDPAQLRILLLGGGGFIGAHLAALLARSGADVSVLSRSASLRLSEPGVRHLRADLSAPPSWPTLDADVVVHLATQGTSLRDALAVDAEVALARHAIEVARRASAAHFVFFGSADEYGAAAAPQREDRERLPLNWYGKAKARCSDLILESAASSGFAATVLRPFSVYGTGQPARMFIGGAVHAAVSRTPFRMSLGTQIRDFVHVDDVAAAVAEAIARRAAGVFNVGTGVGTALIDAVERLRAIAPDLEIVRGDSVAPSDPPALVADTSRARALLGWEARTSLDAGLRKMLTWERSQSA